MKIHFPDPLSTFHLPLFTYLLAVSSQLLALSCLLNADNFGTTSANFLKIGPGTKVSAMADAGSALFQDANTLHWNPAGLVFLEKMDLQTTYLNQLSQLHYSNIGFARPLQEGTVGVAATTLFSADIEGRDETDLPTQNFSFYNWSYSAGYAKKIYGNSSAGVSLKIIREAIGGDVSDTIAFDFGLAGRIKGLALPDNLTTCAFVLQHAGFGLGPGQSSPLPITARLSVLNSIWSNKWSIATELAVPFAGASEINFGNEWKIQPAFCLRAGYRFKRGDYYDSDWFRFLTGGFGLYFIPGNKLQYNLDYAFSTFGNTGFNHHFSFGIKFL